MELRKYTKPDFTEERFISAPEAVFKPAPFNGVAPDNFHAMSIFPEYFKVGREWLLAEESRMDCVPVLKNGRIHVVEFRNFLSDFTLSGERGTADVSLWKDYLIYAQLFGIADKVAKQFKKLYPEGFAQFAQNHGMNDVLFMNTINYSRLVTAHAYSKALSRKIAAEQRQRSSGHGGSSSIGFGGGFSGGGHGGSR